MTALLAADGSRCAIRAAVAVNFVTQIDDVMLKAFVHKASRERLGKYQYEQKWGVESGDTQLKNVSAFSRRLLAAQELLPILSLLLASVFVGGGQVYGRFMREISEGDAACTWLWVPEASDAI